MVSEKSERTRAEGTEEELEASREERRPSQMEEQVGADEARAEEAEEAFDPETAGRGALLAKYRELHARLEESQERLLRVAADAENYKKRLQREKDEQTRYANESFIRELLPVLDNLERALDHSQAGSNNEEGLIKGLQMTLKAFMDTLGRFGCQPLEALGKPFDPKFHEAVSQEESGEYPANTVVRELQKGYILKDRLLRPAMVVVSRSPGGDERPEQGNEAANPQADSTNTKVKVKVNPA